MSSKIAQLCFVVFFISLVGLSPGKYSGGTGEPNDPYLIATPNDLNSIGLDPNDWDKHFLMTADINMAGITDTQFNIIGVWDNRFVGSFDGNEHTISNFTYNAPTASYPVALFADADANCVIKDLMFYEPNLVGNTRVSMLVGRLYDGVISRCHVICGSISGNNLVAGLVGGCESGVITGCSSGADVNCHLGDFAGGLVAISDGVISNCFATGAVYGYGGVGGLVGSSHSGTISDCYAKGSVTGDGCVGGLIGSTGMDLSIFRCYAVGPVIANSSVGGFSGDGSNGSHAECFWDSDVNPDVNGIGNGSDPNVIGLPTAQMQMRSTFSDAAWDMVNVWDIGENQTYPFLRTHLPSDINKDDETNFYDFAILAAHWLDDM